MTEPNLRFALIGATGGVSRLRGRALLANPRAEVVSLCARTEEKWPKAREIHGDMEIVKNYCAAIDRPDVDAVVVSTDNLSHYEIAKFALEHGKHTIVEYPMVMTLEHHDTLTALARDRDVVLADGLTPFVEDYCKAAKDALTEIGTPLFCHYRFILGRTGWYWKREIGGDFFLFVHMHQVAHFYDWFGEVQRVWAVDTVAPCTDGEVHSMPAMFTFRNGTAALLEIATGVPANAAYTATFTGSEGIVEMTVSGKTELTIRKPKGVTETREAPHDYQSYFDRDTDSFVDVVLDNAPPVVPMTVSRNILQSCLAASRAAETGQVQEL